MKHDFEVDSGLKKHFQRVIDLSDNTLEESLVESGGPLDPLTVGLCEGRRVLVDGHRRLALCEKHGFSYQIRERNFKNVEDIKLWMFREQIARRNLSDHERVVLSHAYHEMIKRQRKEGDKPALDQAAEDLGISRRTAARRSAAGSWAEQMPEFWRQALEERRMSVPAKYYRNIAEADPEQQEMLFDRCLDTNSIEPLKEAFPDAKTSVTKVDREKKSRVKPVAAAPEPVEFDRVRYERAMKKAEQTALMWIKSMDELLGPNCLDANNSGWKRRADQMCRDIGGLLKEIKNAKSSF